MDGNETDPGKPKVNKFDAGESPWGPERGGEKG